MFIADFHPATRFSTCAALLALLAGCGNFTSQPYDVATTTGDIKGIPFTLNRPQFTITRTAGNAQTPDSYQITVAYVPDSSQRYVMRMDPALMASIDWTVDFDDSGSLSDTNGKATDQSVAVLTSLASLAGTMALDDTTHASKKAELQLIDQALGKTLNGPGPKIFDEPTRTCVSPSSRNEVRDLQALWSKLQKHFAELALANTLDSFTYGSVNERVLLETALCVRAPTVPQLVRDIESGAQPSDPNVAAIAAQIDDRVVHYDRAALLQIKKTVQQEMDLINAKAQIGAVDDSTSTLGQDFQIKQMATQAIAALNTPPADLLLDLTQIDIATWQARRVATLNNQIQARQFTDRLETGGTGTEAGDRTLVTLRREKARVLGLETALDQLTVLNRISVSDKRYKDSQSLAATLQKQLSDAEAALAPAAAAATADPASTAITLVDTTGQPDEGWIEKQLQDRRPSYVVVLVPTVAGNNSIMPQQPTPSPGGTSPATGSVPSTPTVPPATGGK